jgi:hypothetical protein
LSYISRSTSNITDSVIREVQHSPSYLTVDVLGVNIPSSFDVDVSGAIETY